MKKVISIVLSLCILLSLTACQSTLKTDNIDDFSVMKNAEIIGNLKGQVASEGSFIEIRFPKETTFDTVVIEEKDNQIDKFSIWIEDENGEYQSIYQQDRIGEYRYCEIGEHTAKSLKICINSSNENQYKLNSIDVLNVKENKNEDFRITSYLVCQWFYGNESIDVKKMNTLTDIILFGVARFDENGKVYLQDLDINGKMVDGETIFNDVIKAIKEVNPNAKIHCNILGPDGVDSDDKEKLHSQAFVDNGDILTKNILNLLETYSFDGVFFDYEYPHKLKSIKDYSDFLVKLDSKLENHILGAAFSHWSCNISKEAIKVLDRVEIMAYDNMGQFNAHAEFATVGGAMAVKDFVKRGYDLSKCDLGLPFYGRTHGGDEAWPSYAQIAADLDNNPYKNIIAKSYLNGDISGNITTSFNGVQMIKDKTAFANDYGLGGVMVWHYTCDVDYESDLSLFKAVQTSLESRN
ncbi:MAG: glycoside hydrolase family 18 protein [Clostridia bacterium]|nr:glycoside hydrolase family 18 protein [Clostridia bacterium]